MKLTDEELEKVGGGVDFSEPHWCAQGYCKNCGCGRELYGWDENSQRYLGAKIDWYCSVCHSGNVIYKGGKLPG